MGCFGLMPTKRIACSSASVDTRPLFNLNLNQPRCHACIIDIAEYFLQRLQLLDEFARVTPLKKWSKELCLVAQFLERLAHFVAMFSIKAIQVAGELDGP